MSNTVNLSVPFQLVKMAKERGINISEVARKALAAEVEKSEKARAGSPNTSPELPPTMEAV